MSEVLLVEKCDGVAIVTLNLPAKRNALGPELAPALARTIRDLQDDAAIRALVLHGGTHFCAGGDLAALNAGPLAMRQAMHVGHGAVRHLIGGRLPAVAAVSGCAYGAGFSLALACDFVIGDPTTNFCAAFGRVGLVPDYGLLWTLPQRVGIGKARELLMLCQPVDAKEALAMQLLDRLVDNGETLATAVRLAGEIAAAPPGTIATTKAMLSRFPMPLDTMLAWEADTQALLARTADLREGIEAFAGKRAPRFKGE